MKGKIQKVINLYEESYDNFQGVFIYKDLNPLNTDYTSILFKDNTFYFEFGNDDIEDFKINVRNIKEVIFDKICSINVSILELISGNTIAICNL